MGFSLQYQGYDCAKSRGLWKNKIDLIVLDGWMDGYFVYRRSTLKGHIASNKFYVI